MSLRPAALAIEQKARSNDIVHMSRFLMMAKGDWGSARSLAENRRALPGIVEILKSAVTGGTLDDPSWSSSLGIYPQAIAAFLDSLRNVGAFDTMLPAMRRVPLRSRAAVTTVGLSGTTIGAAMVTPISSLSLDGKQIPERKAVALLTATDELLERSGVAIDLFGRELRLAVAVETDSEFISLITDSVSPITSSGGTAVAILQDLAAALDAIDTTSASELFVLIPARTAKAWSTKTGGVGAIAFPGMTPKGGEICGMQAIVTDGVADGDMVVVDAYQIAAAAGTLEIDTSSQASLQFDTAPDSPAAAATVFQSLFQIGATALKAVRWFGAERLGDNAVAVVTGQSYSGNSPA